MKTDNMSEHLRQGFRLGDYEIHPPNGTISGPRGTRHVTPTAMDILICLAQNPGQLISREQLIHEVWNGSQASESTITRCIADLRHQLDDHPDNPRYIQTLPRRGYRLLADVSELTLNDQTDVLAEPTQPPQAASLAGFFKELNRRRVFRVGLVYMVAAWLIMQIAETVFPALLLPDWSVSLVVILVVLGFPVALILAWAFQVETEGANHSTTSVQYVVDKSRKFDFVVMTALAAAVVILTFELYVREAPDTPPATAATNPVGAGATGSQRPSIAVLPFLNISDDPQNEYFSDGLTEAIMNLLVRIHALDVAARTSSFFYKDKNVDIKTIAKQLGVRNILEGSVRRDQDKIRVTAQLIEGETGFHLWSNTYDRKLEDIFSIQDDIARQVVRVLEIILSSDAGAMLDRVLTESVDAYEYYLQGRNYLRGEYNEIQLQSALSLFDRAISIDQNFAEAYAGLCDTNLAFYEISRSTKFFEHAERACHRGLTLDAKSGDVYAALGNLYRNSGQYDKAVVEFEKAIALNSRDVNAYVGLAETYKLNNRLEDAERTFQQVIDMQPGYWRGYVRMGEFLYYAGRIPEAVQSYTHAVNLAPDSATGYLGLGSAYYLLNDFENAAAAWQKSIDLKPSTNAYMNVGSSYFFLGRFEEAATMYSQASELAPDDFEVWGSLGEAYEYTGTNKALANQAYQTAIELGEKLLGINPADAMTMGALAQYYAHTGNTTRATELIIKAEQLEPQNMYVQYFAAVTHATLGNEDATVIAVERAVALGYPENLLKLDANLTDLGNDRINALLGNSNP